MLTHNAVSGDTVDLSIEVDSSPLAPIVLTFGPPPLIFAHFSHFICAVSIKSWQIPAAKCWRGGGANFLSRNTRYWSESIRLHVSRVVSPGPHTEVEDGLSDLGPTSLPLLKEASSGGDMMFLKEIGTARGEDGEGEAAKGFAE